jgi:trk system potassium uptake protein
MKVLIIGGGISGLTLSNLIGEDNEVTIVEQDEERATKIAEETHAIVVHGDGTDASLLHESGLAEIGAFIATADDKSNLMACQIAKIENIQKIIALVRDPKNEELFTQLGINQIVSEVGTNIKVIKQLLHQKGEARIIAQMGDGELQVVEMRVAKESQLIGKPAILNRGIIAAIYRAGELMIPKESTEISEGDVLLLATKTTDLPAIIETITGT